MKTPFFHQVFRSCYDMEFYRSVRVGSPWRALWYLTRLYLVLAFLGAIIFVPSAIGARTALTEHVRATLPDGARFEMKKGQLSTNVKVPFEIGTKELSVVIDPGVTGADRPAANADGLLFGRDAAFVPANGGTESVRYGNMPDFSWTRMDIMNALDGFSPVLAGLAALTLTFGWAASLLLGATAYVLLLAAISLLGGMMSGVKLSYAQWVASGFHFLTLPTLLTVAFSSTLGRVPFLTTGIFLLFAYAVIADEKADPASAVAGERTGTVLDASAGDAPGKKAGDEEDELGGKK
ncbi:MAG: hypothetical protein RLZZ324_805 [Candidatus Parcubacteria bacterium]|jgi:hypothetical protein